MTATQTAAVKKKPALYFWLVLLALVAFALRLYQLDAVPLRGDEAFNAIHWTKTPFSGEWMTLIQTEPNPGALVTYWAWSRFTGTSEFGLRYLPVLANLFGLAVIVALAHRLGRDGQSAWALALLVGGLWALNPFFIWHAQDARQYSLLTALTPLNFYLLLRAAQHDRRGHWLLYLLIQTYTVYTYYIELFWVVAQGLYVLTLRRPGLLRRFILVWLLILPLLLPLFLQIYTVLFLQGYAGTAARADFPQLFTVFLPTLLFGESRIPLVLGLAAAGALAAGLISQRRWLLLFWIVVPLLLLTLASTQSNLFLPRYVVAVGPALLISVVLVLYGFLRSVMAGAGGRRQALYMTAAFCALMGVVALVQVRAYFTIWPAKSADWPGLVAYLEARLSADDVLISDSIDPALEYYYTGPARIFFIPAEDPPPQAYLPGILTQHTGVYLLAGRRTGPAGDFLQAQAQPVPGDRWPGVAQFRPWQVHPAEIQHPLDLRFAEVAHLRGYTILPQATLILYWEALQSTEAEHSVLLHLAAAPDAPPIAVLDHGMANATLSTRTWQPGTLYRDPIPLPPDLPEGEYTLLVGLYPTGTAALLSVDAAGQNIKNDEGRYRIGTLIIAKN